MAKYCIGVVRKNNHHEVILSLPYNSIVEANNKSVDYANSGNYKLVKLYELKELK